MQHFVKHLVIAPLLFFCSAQLAWANAQMRGEYTIPMFFETRGDLGKELAPRFDYSIDDNFDLLIADKRISTKSFSTSLRTTTGEPVLHVQWPANFVSKGKLLVLSTANKEVIADATIDQGRVGIRKTEADKNGQTVAVSYMTFSLGESDIARMSRAAFQVCVDDRDDRYRVMFCQKPMILQQGPKMKPAETTVPTAITINEQPVRSHGSVNFNDTTGLLKFFARYTNGAYYTIETQPRALTFLDVKQDGDVIKARGQGGPPTGQNVRFDEEDPTTWTATLDPKKPLLTVLGEGQIPFTHEFYFFKDLPTENERPYLHERSRITTYLSAVTVKGRAPLDFVAKSDSEVSAVKENMKSGKFNWRVSKLEQGKWQRRSLLMSNEQKTFYPYREFYRGYPYELSVRLTNIAQTDPTPMLLVHGEVAGGAWFESIYSDNYWLSLRRWGLYGRYFTALNGTGDNKYSLMNFDVKYRFTPGVWGNDESWGFLGSAASFNHGGFSTGQLLGVGIFWARKMPQSIDEIFNLVPWFRYPKWVDFDATFYQMPLDSRVALGAQNFKISFHGKMNILPHLFIEAGFGMMGFEWETTDTSDAVSMLYGSGGIGYNF